LKKNSNMACEVLGTRFQVRGASAPCVVGRNYIFDSHKTYFPQGLTMLLLHTDFREGTEKSVLP